MLLSRENDEKTWQIMINKTLHRISQIKQHEPLWKSGVKSGAPEKTRTTVAHNNVNHINNSVTNHDRGNSRSKTQTSAVHIFGSIGLQNSLKWDKHQQSYHVTWPHKKNQRTSLKVLVRAKLEYYIALNGIYNDAQQQT